jgi:hypothetical protein
MRPFLEAQDAFVHWLDGPAVECQPTAAEVDHELRRLAACAADRGMSPTHWTFVVDGLIAHAKRRCPENVDLPDLIARGFDFSTCWSHLEP